MAAMNHLCSGKNWDLSILTLCKQLLEGGCIETRWVVILASDAIRSNGRKKIPDITTISATFTNLITKPSL
jgi:hypothetical protein